MTTFQGELREQATAALGAEGEVAHRWEKRGSALILHFPGAGTGGFPVSLEADEKGVVVTAGRMHVHLDDSGPPGPQVREALGLVRDLLSPTMRLRELRFLGIPYRWYLESEQDGAWAPEHEMGLLIWIPPWFASPVMYQNDQLPPRRAV